MLKTHHAIIAGLAVLLAITPAAADEGMWLFEDLPLEILRDEHGFEPTDAWAEHLRLASVRFSSGGSASFISSNGLVLTNHHVAEDTLHKLSTADRDLNELGYLARSRDEELPAPDLELNQLVSIEDVTDRVQAVVAEGVDADAATLARRAAIAEIEAESLAATGLRSNVITLFGGARYHLYRFKRHTDVRLVWAPEAAAAFFGGDNDNFEYPRYCMDVTLFRVYENGEPLDVEHFLEWSDNGAEDGELVFVSGNPGRTERDRTAAALRFQRDHALPTYLRWLCRMEIETQQYRNEGPEQRRRAHEYLFGVQNNRKRMLGMIEGLQDPAFMDAKERAEESFRDRLRASSELAHYDDAWDRIADAQTEKAQIHHEKLYLSSRLYQIAQQLVLLAGEDAKPNAERYEEFRDSGRESLELELYSPAPIYKDLEITRLSASLSLAAGERGGDDPLVQTLLDGKSPEQRAAELIHGTRLEEVAVRKELGAGGLEAIESSDDPLIQLFRAIEDQHRQVRDREEQVEEVEKQAYADIKAAQIGLDGATGYPDATFSLRLAFGTVRGYEEAGKTIAPFTTIGGAYEHERVHRSQEPWRLPESWHEAEGRVNKSKRLNFVCTADIIGGNSGSPVVNRAGEFVGIIFDGNIQSLTAAYAYDDRVSRAVSVHSSGIREALRTVYGAGELADELGR